MSETQQNGALSGDEWTREQSTKSRPWEEPPAPMSDDEEGQRPPVERHTATGPELNAEVAAYLEQAPGSLFAGRPAHILAQWDGSENLLWRFAVEGFEGSAVLKLFPDAGLARGRRMIDAHERFAAAGLAPRTFWYDRAPEGLPEPLVVYGWVEGDALADGDAEGLLLLADVAAGLHTGSVEGISRYGTQPLSLASWLELQRASVASLVPWLGERDSALAVSVAALGNATLAVASNSLPLWRDVALCPTHGDLLPENVLRTTAGTSPLTLVDWEGFGLGDPAREVVRLMQIVAAEGDVDPNEWLARYLAQAPLPNLGERIELYSRLLPFESLCSLLTSLRTAPPALDAPARAEAAMLLATVHHAASLAAWPDSLVVTDSPPDYAPLLA